MMEELSKNILYVSICIRSSISRIYPPFAVLFGESQVIMQDHIRRHSTMLNESSDSDG